MSLSVSKSHMLIRLEDFYPLFYSTLGILYGNIHLHLIKNGGNDIKQIQLQKCAFWSALCNPVKAISEHHVRKESATIIRLADIWTAVSGLLSYYPCSNYLSFQKLSLILCFTGTKNVRRKKEKWTIQAIAFSYWFHHLVALGYMSQSLLYFRVPCSSAFLPFLLDQVIMFPGSQPHHD